MKKIQIDTIGIKFGTRLIKAKLSDLKASVMVNVMRSVTIRPIKSSRPRLLSPLAAVTIPPALKPQRLCF